MASALAGDTRAHKHVQDARRARMQAGPPPKTAEQLRQDIEDEEKKKELSAKLVKMLDLIAEAGRIGILVSGGIKFYPWLEDAIRDYRAKHDMGPGSDFYGPDGLPDDGPDLT